MNATIQNTLLDLFNQVSADPDRMPTVPIDTWPEDAEERQLLAGFSRMLTTLHQSHEDALRERKEIEEQLREREEQYRSIFEATYDGLAILDLERCYVEVNPAFCQMFGYAREELIGMNVSALAPPVSQPNIVEAMDAFKAGRDYHAIGDALRKDGIIFICEARSSLFIYRGQRHILVVARDATERVEAEKQLREKEAQYRSIFEATSDGLIIRDMDGFVVEANPTACTIHGYAYEEFLGLHRTDIIDPKDHAMVAEYMKAIREGHSFLGQAVDLRKDGTPFPVEVRGTTFTYQGKPHTLSVLRDITERVEAERQLREREEQYRSIFEATSDGLIIRNMDGAVVQVNPAACKMHGYSYEEYMALSRDTLIHPDYHPQLREIIQTIKAGRAFQGQAVDLRKDGSTFPVEFRSDTFMYLGQPHMLTVLRDITERVEAEKQLREREEQYRSIFEATSDAMLIRDLEDGHVVEANPAACQMYGYSYEEFIGLDATVITHSDSLRLLPGGLQTVRAGHQLLFQGLGLRKDGTSIHVEVRGTPFTYKSKPHLLGVSRDITEQVQAQQLLEQRVEERTRELSTLLEVSHNVASTLELKRLLNLILEQLKTVVDYDGAAIATRQGDEFTFLDYQGPLTLEEVIQLRLLFSRSAGHLQVFQSGEPVIIPDTHDSSPLARSLQESSQEHLAVAFSRVQSWMGIPLKLKDQVIGMLTLSAHQPNYYTPQQARLALAIANQAAVAIENARLYEQAQQLAALEERQKLARELHDSVSQALYGISLGAHAARTALQRDPQQVAEPLDYVLSLTEAALAEMRALIFELRPESLETEGLVSALSKQTAALQARHEIAVSTQLCDEPDLPITVKKDLYRVVQEAMHNTVKHARANHINLRLEQTADGVLLEIHDDGVGFDTSASFPGHLGLHSMRERVTNLGGTFETESEQGKGTRIFVRIPDGI